MKTVRIVRGNVDSKIVSEDWNENIKRYLFSHCWVPVDFFVSKFSGRKTQREYLITKAGKWKDGLTKRIKKLLEADGYTIIEEDERTNLKEITATDIIETLRECNYKLRDYQVETLYKLIRNQGGIASVATGGGKSFILSALVATLKMKTFICVSSTDLVQQIREDIADFTGIPIEEIGIISSGVWNEQQITVGNYQAITGRISEAKKPLVKEFLESINCLVVDEVHNAQAKSYKDIVRKCKNAPYRFGFTATPMTSKVSTETGKSRRDMILEAFWGPIVSNVSANYLIDRGWLAKPTIVSISNRVGVKGEILEFAEEYERTIVQNEERNRLIAEIIFKHYQKEEQIIGFVNRIDHGHILRDILVDEFGVYPDDIEFVTGQDFTTSRKDKISSFKDGRLPILIGTVLSEGLNFFCDVGINIAPSDSDRLSLQRLGRILRKKKNPVTKEVDVDVPSNVTFYDFADYGHPWFRKHAKGREKLYVEYGFESVSVKPEEVLGDD